METEIVQSVGPNWLIVLGLGASGLLMGLLACFVGLKQAVEFVLWTVLYAVWVVIVKTIDAPAPFRTILIAGPIAGVLNATVTLSLFDNYRRSNPWYADQVDKPKGQLAGSFFGMGIGMGLLYGAIFGGIAWWLA